MMNYNSTNLLAAGWHLHMIFAGALIVGAILFIVWASKLDKKALKTLIIWLLIVGALGTLLTGHFGFRGMQRMMGGGFGHMGNWDNDKFSEAQTPEELSQFMFDEMKEHMGLEEEK